MISCRVWVKTLNEVTTKVHSVISIFEMIEKLDAFNVFYDHHFTIFCNKSKVTRSDTTWIERHLLRTRTPASLGHQASTISLCSIYLTLISIIAFWVISEGRKGEKNKKTLAGGWRRRKPAHQRARYWLEHPTIPNCSTDTNVADGLGREILFT